MLVTCASAKGGVGKTTNEDRQEKEGRINLRPLLLGAISWGLTNAIRKRRVESTSVRYT
jgi:hypothetical protein